MADEKNTGPKCFQCDGGGCVYCDNQGIVQSLDQWRKAFDREGAVMSEICRKALDRFAARSERKQNEAAK